MKCSQKCKGCRRRIESEATSSIGKLYCVSFNIKDSNCPCSKCIVKTMCNPVNVCQEWSNWWYINWSEKCLKVKMDSNKK